MQMLEKMLKDQTQLTQTREQELTEKNSELQAANQLIEDLKLQLAQLGQSQTLSTTLQSQLDAKETQIGDLTQKLDEKTQAAQSLQTQLSAVEEELATTKTEHDELLVVLAETDAEVSELKKQLGIVDEEDVE